jgi:Protein of unknown function (DUF3027)
MKATGTDGGALAGQRGWLAEDLTHFCACHKRWADRRNRRQEAPGYRDEWYAEQCLFCRYWVPLIGAFADDYGACSNPRSPFDATVRFEHDGCAEFDPDYRP